MDYTFKEITISNEDIVDYSTFLSLVFHEEKKFTSKYLMWLYGENTYGTVVGTNAFDGEKLIGHYATIPVKYSINGIETKGLLSLNTAVHPDYQGKGLFTKLANITYENAEILGYEFVIGVANQNSTPGFIKKLGFQLVCSLDVKIGLGKSKNRLIDKTFYPIRNDKFLRWRLSNPSKIYFRKESSVFSGTGKFGILAQLTSSLIISDEVSKLKKTTPFFKLIIGKGLDKSIKGLFFELPSFLKPSPLNLIFKNLTGETLKVKDDEIFFELIDFDAY